MHRLHSRACVSAACLSVTLALSASGQNPAPTGPARSQAAPSVVHAFWRTTGGHVVLLPHEPTLDAFGLALQTQAQTATSREYPFVSSVFAIDGSEGHGLRFSTRNGAFHALVSGDLPTIGEMVLVLPDGNLFPIGDFDFKFTVDGVSPTTGETIETMSTDRPAFSLSSGMFQFDAGTGRFEWAGIDVYLNEVWALELGIPQAGGALIGSLVIQATAVETPDFPPPSSDPPGEDDGSGPLGLASGPDVIVGDLHELARYGTSGGITAYAVGTVSCNVGDFWLNWFSNTNQHPVIAQNLYRLKGGRFEQIGQSWLKHGFFALSGSLCFNDCESTDGTHLGVHCSDPYSASLNGQQSNLGPRYQVNAATGVFTYPPANPSTPPTIGRRLQVRNTDLDPAQNAGALYFVEGHYVTPDDASAGNKNNNASYRRVNVGSSPFNLSFVGGNPTQREKAAIQAWKANDAAVTLAGIDVTGDGHMDLAYRVTDLGGGQFHYEYALYNMNSDRSGQAFEIPIPAAVTVSNIGFHDVDYHSGEPFAGTDWPGTVGSGKISWATQTFAQNQNANALRWGTLYNFRFDADAPPQAVNGTVVLFKPGSPSSVNVVTLGPAAACLDALPPTIQCPADITNEATSPSGAVVNFSVTGTDDCDPLLTIISTPSSGSTFPLGATTVNSTATDDAGNSAACSFMVTVRDTTAPTIQCPANLTREATSAAGAVVTFNVNASDLVDTSPTIVSNPPSGSLFGFGTTQVNSTATDDAGNVSNCSFMVTVRDTTAPTIQCPADITADCANGGVVTFDVTATDVVDPSPTVICTPPSGSTFPPGTTPVNCSASDDEGNTSNCSFDVTTEDSPCLRGNVNATSGAPMNVLLVNGSAGDSCTREIDIPRLSPISVSLSPAIAPNPAPYTVWVWRYNTQNPGDVIVGGVTIGCAANPTPFRAGEAPQPFRCVRGGLGSQYCGSVRELAGAPATAPWTLTRNQGLGRVGKYLLQGVLRDDSADNVRLLSVTNATILDIQ